MLTEAKSEDLYQLVYISERSHGTDDAQINQIKQQAELHNQQTQITGALLFSQRYFLQYLEGDKTRLDALYARICRDHRHQNVRLLQYKAISQRDFSRWSLGVKKLLDTEENQDLLRLLTMLGQASTISETQLDWFKLALN